MTMYDMVIKNGKIIDGTGSDGYFSDIANYNVTFYEKSYIGSQGRRISSVTKRC